MLPRASARPEKQLPVARDDSSTVLQGETIEISVLENDTNPTEKPLTIAEVQDGESGITTLNENNTITYTHDGSSNRPNDSFTYRIANSDGESEASVTISVRIPVPKPIANNDARTIEPGETVILDVLSNDTSLDDSLTLVNVASGSSGETTIKDGQIVYRHAAESGNDSFTYTIHNSAGEKAQATVTISVVVPVTPPQSMGDNATVFAGDSVPIDDSRSERWTVGRNSHYREHHHLLLRY